MPKLEFRSLCPRKQIHALCLHFVSSIIVLNTFVYPLSFEALSFGSENSTAQERETCISRFSLFPGGWEKPMQTMPSRDQFSFLVREFQKVLSGRNFVLLNNFKVSLER